MSEHEPDRLQEPQRIGLREFRGKLSDYLRQAHEGASFLITSHDVVVAEIRPPAPLARPRRQPGGMEGKIWMAPDFDTLPAEVLAAMEGDAE
jgi:antitoxin (DNA-binding transcriptional repressor) of toxin-antitoxin stability system